MSYCIRFTRHEIQLTKIRDTKIRSYRAWSCVSEWRNLDSWRLDNTIFRNVGKPLPSDAMSHPRRMHHHTIQINHLTRCNNFSSLLLDTAVFPCNYIFTFLSVLHVSTYFLGHHQVHLVCYLFRSLCKATIDFVFGWYYILRFHSVRYCNKPDGPDDGLENRLKHVVQIKM